MRDFQRKFERSKLFSGMKTRITGTLAAMSLWILTCGALLSSAPTCACTVYCYGQGDSVLAGRSFDLSADTTLGLLFVPAPATTHGWVCGGRSDFSGPCGDGMNDHGLFAGFPDAPASSHPTTSSRKPADVHAFISGLLANCATVDEAISWCEKQPTPSLDGWVHHNSRDYKYITVGHFLVADRSGDSVVFEWPHGKLEMTRKRGRYQLITNFLLSDPEAGNYPCPRYIADSWIFDTASGPALQTCHQMLQTTAQGCTRYSVIYDLKHGDVQVYLRQHFDQPKTLHLADELQKGRHELDMDQWFGRRKPGPLSPPPVIAKSTLSAAEILQRALAALGGAKAAAKIRSIHAKGRFDSHDLECLRGLPTDVVAMRPDRFRTVVDVIQPGGHNLGQYADGFDGHIGWNSGFGVNGSCHILRGEEYELRKDDAVFFGCADEPGNYETAECLGEAAFDGKLCFDVKLVTRTHHEQFYYYDTTNFLLAGTFTRKWMKTTYCDYRPFDGFLMPTRVESRSDTGGSLFQFDSLEINTVTDIPPAPQAQLLSQLDAETYDRYAGQYRVSVLFGLFHVGPTLCVSHMTNEIGDHLIAWERGDPPAQTGDFLPVSKNSFVMDDPDLTDDTIRLTFVRFRNGKATRIIVNWNGKILNGARISDKPAG
jgi:Acyl-coenzyme A:6-aminopenicillanic acid acyl-transferase